MRSIIYLPAQNVRPFISLLSPAPAITDILEAFLNHVLDSVIPLLRHRRDYSGELGIVEPVLWQLSLIDEVVPLAGTGESPLPNDQPSRRPTGPAPRREELPQLGSILHPLQRRPAPPNGPAHLEVRYIAPSSLRLLSPNEPRQLVHPPLNKRLMLGRHLRQLLPHRAHLLLPGVIHLQPRHMPLKPPRVLPIRPDHPPNTTQDALNPQSRQGTIRRILHVPAKRCRTGHPSSLERRHPRHVLRRPSQDRPGLPARLLNLIQRPLHLGYLAGCLPPSQVRNPIAQAADS